MSNYLQRAGQYIGQVDDGQQTMVRRAPVLFIFGQDEQLQAVLLPIVYFDAVHAEQLNGEQSFKFSIPGDHQDAHLVAEGALVAFRDPDQDYLMFEVKLVVDSHDEQLIRTAYCQPSYLELLDEHLENVEVNNAGAEYAIMQALTNTRWESGLVDSFGSKTTVYERTNPIAALQQVLVTWGGELRFRVTLSATGQVTGRYVDLLAMRGADTGKRFEFGKDVAKDERTVDLSGLKTALYGYGKSTEDAAGNTQRVTFADVEWSVASGDPVDKPLGQAWVGDPAAMSLWGRAGGTRHRYGQYEDSDITDPAELLAATWAQLQVVSTPLVNYAMDVIDLEQLAGLEHEAVRLGDTVGVIDRDLGIEVKARIIQLQRNLTQPEKSAAELGNFLPTLASDRNRTIALERKVNDRVGIWNDKITAGRSYKSVYIDGDSGLRVLDELNRERVRLGEYVAGKYGMVLYDASGNVVILDQDGILQTWQEGRADNIDDGHPLTLNIYLPPETKSVHKALLRLRLQKFRAYETGASAGGSVSTTSGSGGGESATSSSGGSSTPTSGVGSWSSGGSLPVDFMSFPGDHNHGVANGTVLLKSGGGTVTFVASGNHAHSLYAAHTHTITIPNHQHTVTIGSHAHSVSIPDHTHSIVYGIYEGAQASGVSVSINGVDRTAILGGPFSSDQAGLSISAYLVTGQWNTISMGSAAKGRIDASVFIQARMGV